MRGALRRVFSRTSQRLRDCGDAAGAIWPSQGPTLADPAGGRPVCARMDAETTREAAELVAGWFEDGLLAATRRAPR